MNLLRAWLECRCPACREGKVFNSPVWDLKRFHQMPQSCPVCNKNFFPEPGFYFGAMFISNAFTVALMTAIWIFLRVLFDPQEYVYIWSLIGMALLLTPLSFRHARLLWLYWFG
jgi:uncharacterized protein (DUF983 family)